MLIIACICQHCMDIWVYTKGCKSPMHYCYCRETGFCQGYTSCIIGTSNSSSFHFVYFFFSYIIVTFFCLTLKLVFLCFGVYTANCSQLRIISMLLILTYMVKRGCKSKMHILLVDTLWDPVFFLSFWDCIFHDVF